MTIRTLINRHPALTAALASAALLIGFVSIYLGGRTNKFPEPKAFYTSDDGATLFADEYGKAPPFDHDGKPAVRAFVFSCDDGKSQFVQYLQKFSEDDKAQLTATQLNKGLGIGLIKKPGSSDWVREASSAAIKIMAPPCPDAMAKGQYRQVLP